MTPKRIPPNHDHDKPFEIEDQLRLKRAQIAAWRQGTDPTPCECEVPLDLALFKPDAKPLGQEALENGNMTKRSDAYRDNPIIESYVILCPNCGEWFAVGQKTSHNDL